MSDIGPMIVAFFDDYLKVQKGLRPNSVRSYRDVLKLFLNHVAGQHHRPVTRLGLPDLESNEVLLFLQSLESDRNNYIRTRNQRLTVLKTFFRYLASRAPEMIAEAKRVEGIPVKRCAPAPTDFLEKDEIDRLLRAVPKATSVSLRDRALLTLLYNTGARVQEVADLRVKNLDLDGPYRARLHGKGDKWRVCPLWPETASLLKQVIAGAPKEAPVFVSRLHRPLTRFGIYQLVKKYASSLPIVTSSAGKPRRISPHIFRHTAAVHLLESGVDINVIRAWLGHVSLETTNRYAEINIRMKEAAVALCTPLTADTSEGSPSKKIWHDDPDLMKWLNSL